METQVVAAVVDERVELERCLSALAGLLYMDSAPESEFQALLERHPVAFRALGFARAIPQPEIRSQARGVYRPDFLVQRPNGFWELLELKRADTFVVRELDRRAAFYATMQSYVSQCQEYSLLLQHDVSTRGRFERDYDITLHSAVPVTLIAGRSATVDRLRVYELLGRQNVAIEYQTFDELFEQVGAYHADKCIEPAERAGISLFAVVQLHRDCPDKGGSLFELGSDQGGNHVGVFRCRGSVLAVRIVDAEGLTLLREVDLGPEAAERPLLLGLHIVPVGVGLSVLLEIDGVYLADLRVAVGALHLDAPFALAIGTDSAYSPSAGFILGEFAIRGPSLNVVERTSLREAFLERASESLARTSVNVRGLSFSGSQSMYTEGHPIHDPIAGPRTSNLVQRDNARRPTTC